MRIFTSAVIAAFTLALSTAAFADNHYHGGRDARSRHHEGESYRGHRLHQSHGRWGYYQPRNGANVFITIPL